MARIVVTGGAGFIGSHIVERFLKVGGHEIHVIDDLSTGERANLFPAVQFHQADIRSPQAAALLATLRPEILVHTAAQISVRLSMEDPVNDTDINVKGLVNLLHAFRGKNLPFVVFTSTGGAIYGEQEKFPADENHPLAPASVYGLAKRTSELYLELWQRQYGLRFAALRLANVYGPRQNPHGEAGVIAIFCKKLLKGETPTINGSGEQTRDFVFVQDVARAVEQVASGRVCGIFNIGTGVETSVNELYGYIRQSLSSPIAAVHGPTAPGEQLRSCIDNSRARKTFGWKPELSIREGVEQTAAWFKLNQNR